VFDRFAKQCTIGGQLLLFNDDDAYESEIGLREDDYRLLTDCGLVQALPGRLPEPDEGSSITLRFLGFHVTATRPAQMRSALNLYALQLTASGRELQRLSARTPNEAFVRAFSDALNRKQWVSTISRVND
jgi:hypothetical protein